MNDRGALLFWLIAWLVGAGLAIVPLWRRERLSTAGLTVAYLLSLFIIHFTGAATYLVDVSHRYDFEQIVTGVRESVWAVFAFAAGAVLIAPVLARRFRGGAPHGPEMRVETRTAVVYLFMGWVLYVILGAAKGTPTVTALASTGLRVFVVGLCLMLWKKWTERKPAGVAFWFAVVLWVPFATVLAQGYIGYGTFAIIVALTFMASVIRPRRVVIVLAVIGAYVGLSTFVSYSQVRDDLREVIWGGRPMAERMEAVYAATVGVEWFDPGNEAHLDQLDKRLNQSGLVGPAVENLRERGDYAYGRTMWDSVLSLIPRALWPDKPVVAGSGDLVSEYTGFSFSHRSSVGIGHVLEAYVNFGTVGVVIVFMMLGAVLATIDLYAARRLLAGDHLGFGALLLVGSAFMHVGGSFVDLTASVGASAVVAYVLNYYLRRGAPAPQPLRSPVEATA